MAEAAVTGPDRDSEAPEATPVAKLPAAPPIEIAPTVAEVTTVASSGASVDPVA